MKRPLALFFALSLLANIALAIALNHARSANTAAATGATHSRDIALNDNIITAINAGPADAGALLARLKAAGLPDKTARYIAAALEFQKYSEQLAGLTPEHQPYWRNRFTSRADQSPETRLKIQQATRAMQDAMTDLFAETLPQFASRRHAYLTPERRAGLRRLEKDYDDLTAELFASTGNFQLQSDIDQLKTLADERKREIDQFLTPDETAARELRESATARSIRSEYGNIIETEDEYKNIYAIMQAAGDDAGAQAGARAQIDALLGSDRLAQLARLNDTDYELAQSAAARLNLPAAATTAGITAIRDEARQASAAIISDNSLTRLQKREAIQNISNKSREQMDAVLGAEGAEAYARRSSWMNALKNGSSFTIDERGKFKTQR